MGGAPPSGSSSSGGGQAGAAGQSGYGYDPNVAFGATPSPYYWDQMPYMPYMQQPVMATTAPNRPAPNPMPVPGQATQPGSAYDTIPTGGASPKGDQSGYYPPTPQPAPYTYPGTNPNAVPPGFYPGGGAWPTTPQPAQPITYPGTPWYPDNDMQPAQPTPTPPQPGPSVPYMASPQQTGFSGVKEPSGQVPWHTQLAWHMRKNAIDEGRYDPATMDPIKAYLDAMNELALRRAGTPRNA